MSRIDFYILPGRGELARQQFACRLAEKAYRLNNKVHIQVADRVNVNKLDDLLWTFRDGSFVPHEIAEPAETDTDSPVTIGCDILPSTRPDLLINLGDTILDNASSFPRVAEVVTSDESSLTNSRHRFVEYRDQGHRLNTHKL